MLAGWRCRRRGHDWFPPDVGPGEFTPRHHVCLRCHALRCWLPTGACLGPGARAADAHPLAEHYDAGGEPVLHPTCPGPR